MQNRLKIILIIILLIIPLSLFPGQDKNENLNRLKLAQTLEKIGEYQRAFEIFKILYEIEPNNPNYSMGYERNMQNLKMFDELVAHYDERLKNNPLDLNISGKLGEAYYRWGKTEKADSVWNSILERNPKGIVNYAFLSNVFINNRLYDKAVEVLLEGRKKLNNSSLFESELANLYFWKKEYVKGTKEYIKILGHNPKAYNSVESRILGIFSREEISETDFGNIEGLMRAEVEKSNENHYFRRLLGSLYFTNQMYDLAFEEYKNLDRQLNAGGKEVLMFTDKLLSERVYENSALGYEYIKVNFPVIKDLAAACLGLAYSYEKLGSPAEDESRSAYIFSKVRTNYQEKNQYLLKAIDEYKEIIKKYPVSHWAMRSYFRIGEIKLNLTFDLDGAVEYFTNIVKFSTDSIISSEAVLKIGDSMLAKGDLQQANIKYNEVLSLIKENDIYYRALYKKAYVSYLNGDFKEAEDIANSILMKQPPSSKIYNEVLELLMFIDENKRNDENALLEYVRAQSLVEQRKYSEAIEFMENIKRVYANHQISDDAIFLAGKLRGFIGDYEGAVNAFRELIAEYPASFLADETQLRIGELYEVCIEDYALAEKEYESLLVNYPNSIYVDEVRRRIRHIF
ncbi:tetratricopeptide repeat protein [candidate division KSB1 bacterium]